MPLSKEEEAELANLEKKRSPSESGGKFDFRTPYERGELGSAVTKATGSKLAGTIANEAPAFIMGGGVGKVAGGALAAPVAEHMMVKALGPTGNLSVREADKLTQSALKHGINVTRGGVQKLRGMLRDLGQKAEGLISNSNAVVRSRDVLRDLTSPEGKAAFRAMRMRFKGGDIPIREAQRAKQEISRRLSDYSYRDLNMSGQSAKLEGMKQLQSVLRNKIEQLEPGIKDLNSKMHDLFSLRPHLEKRVVQNMQKTVGTGPLSVGARAVQQGGSAAGATAGGLGGIGLDEAVNR